MVAGGQQQGYGGDWGQPLLLLTGFTFLAKSASPPVSSIGPHRYFSVTQSHNATQHQWYSGAHAEAQGFKG